MKLLLLFFDARKVYMGFMKVATKLVFIFGAIFILLAGINFVIGGEAELSLYIEEIDFWGLFSIILVFLFVVPSFILICLALSRLYGSYVYCKRNNCSLTEFFKKSDNEILELWGYKK